MLMQFSCAAHVIMLLMLQLFYDAVGAELYKVCIAVSLHHVTTRGHKVS